MSLDAATHYLTRKDRKLLRRRLKDEEAKVIVQASHGDHIGLFAVTAKRILFVHKKRIGAVQRMTARRDIAKLTQHGDGHGGFTFHVGKAQWRFTCLQRGAKDAVLDVLQPQRLAKTGSSKQVRSGGPMVFTPKPKPTGKAHPRQGSGHDPLTASKQDKLARLERLKAGGRITDAEYRWQKDALERA